MKKARNWINLSIWQHYRTRKEKRGGQKNHRHRQISRESYDNFWRYKKEGRRKGEDLNFYDRKI